MQNITLKWMIFEHWFNKQIGWYMTNTSKQPKLEKIIEDQKKEIDARLNRCEHKTITGGDGCFECEDCGVKDH